MSRESEYVEYGRWLAEHVLTRPLTEDQIDRAARIQADALREARLAERKRDLRPWGTLTRGASEGVADGILICPHHHNLAHHPHWQLTRHHGLWRLHKVDPRKQTP